MRFSASLIPLFVQPDKSKIDFSAKHALSMASCFAKHVPIPLEAPVTIDILFIIEFYIK